jgi:hypothetical protein
VGVAPAAVAAAAAVTAGVAGPVGAVAAAIGAESAAGAAGLQPRSSSTRRPAQPPESLTWRPTRLTPAAAGGIAKVTVFHPACREWADSTDTFQCESKYIGDTLAPTPAGAHTCSVTVLPAPSPVSPVPVAVAG